MSEIREKIEGLPVHWYQINAVKQGEYLSRAEVLAAIDEHEPKWIKTTDWLPEREPDTSYSQVTCLVVRNGEVETLVFNHEHMCWDDESGDDFECAIGDVSHWMLAPELPLPPEEST